MPFSADVTLVPQSPDGAGAQHNAVLLPKWSVLMVASIVALAPLACGSILLLSGGSQEASTTIFASTFNLYSSLFGY